MGALHALGFPSVFVVTEQSVCPSLVNVHTAVFSAETDFNNPDLVHSAAQALTLQGKVEQGGSNRVTHLFGVFLINLYSLAKCLTSLGLWVCKGRTCI